MPRGNAYSRWNKLGEKSGEKRPFRKKTDDPQYIPKKLRRRLHDWAEDPKVGFQQAMSKKPGSQNPRKSGPKRTGGV